MKIGDFNPKKAKLPAEHEQNLNVLFGRVIVLCVASELQWIVTSGYRTLEDHKRIYAKKTQNPAFRIPMKSRHLSGEAVDIADADGRIKEWIARNPQLLESVGLWCEDFKYTPTWVHLQTQPPPSGKRFFIP